MIITYLAWATLIGVFVGFMIVAYKYSKKKF